MIQNIRISGQCKSGKNNMVVTKQGRHFPRAPWAKWRDGVLQQIVPQWKGKFDHPCHITIDYTPGDLIRRDAPGIIDALFHCLERGHFVTDDTLFKNVLFRTHGLDRKAPGVIIAIESLHDGVAGPVEAPL